MGFATPAYAAPNKPCSPWPSCKDDAQGPGESDCNTEYDAATCYKLNTTNPCPLVRFNDNTSGWNFKENCQTSEPLVIFPPDHILHGNGHTLTLVAPWSTDPDDRAAITNFGGRAVVRDIKIHVADSDVANGSCDGSSPVEAAISFDTHGTTSSVPGLVVNDVVVTVAGGAQFCNAIEYVSENAPEVLQFFPGRILDSEIGPDSYSNFGILVTNINTSDSNTAGNNNNVGIKGNVVHSSQDGCVGIQVGPWVERADIEFNVIDVPECKNFDEETQAVVDLGGVGISVLTTGVAEVSGGTGNPPDVPPTNDFLAPRPANIVDNIVNIGDSLDVGISIVNSAIDKNQENAISGVDGDDHYCVRNSGTVSFPTKGKKKNTFNVDGTTTTIIADDIETCP